MVAPESGTLFPSSGFVVAMQARWAGSKMADPLEWIVVSRFGLQNEYLALHRTQIAASSGEPPLHLSPYQTAIATLAMTPDGSAGTSSATFRLSHVLPKQVLMTGDFMPARGYVRVYGAKPNLALQAAGRWLKPGRDSEFRLTGRRVPWLGEFFE
jgi:hypothetical protein